MEDAEKKPKGKTAEQLRMAWEKKQEEERQAKQDYHNAMAEEADDAIREATDVFAQYSQFITKPQLNRLARALNATIDLNPEDDDGGEGTKKAKGTRAPKQVKFHVNGTDWTGVGRTPKAFEEWDKSAEGKKWRADNPKQQYPFAKGYTPTDDDKNWRPKTAAERAAEKAKREEAKAKRQAEKNKKKS